MSGYNPTGESEYFRNMRLASLKAFDAEMHKRDFERRYRPLIENGMTESEFIRGDVQAREDTLEDFRALKEQMEYERAQDAAFIKGFMSVKGPYERYNPAVNVQEETAGGTD